MGKDAKEEKKFGKGFFFFVFLTVVLLLSMIFLYLMADMEPKVPEATMEDLEEWMDVLENTIWDIDKSTKQEELEELSFHTVKTISFSERGQESKTLPCYLETPEMLLAGEVFQEEGSLILSLDGFLLELWYSKNQKGEFKTLTLKGSDSWLFFTLEE